MKEKNNFFIIYRLEPRLTIQRRTQQKNIYLPPTLRSPPNKRYLGPYWTHIFCFWLLHLSLIFLKFAPLNLETQNPDR